MLCFVLDYVAPVTLLFIYLVFAAIDRYIALTFPFRYKQINSIKLAKIVSIFIWLSSAVIHIITSFIAFKRKFLPSLLFQPTFYFSSSMKTFNQIITALILFLLFCLLWILTFMTLCSLYKRYKRSLVLNKKSLKGFSLEKQMSFVLVFMVVAFTFSLFPTIYLHICSFNFHTNYGEKATYISISFLTTNSVWNLIIYNILNKNFCTALINIYFRCK